MLVSPSVKTCFVCCVVVFRPYEPHIILYMAYIRYTSSRYRDFCGRMWIRLATEVTPYVVYQTCLRERGDTVYICITYGYHAHASGIQEVKPLTLKTAKEKAQDRANYLLETCWDIQRCGGGVENGCRHYFDIPLNGSKRPHLNCSFSDICKVLTTMAGP